ncbi:hypothetical protein L284_00130 [Novosphingobium lindaniclasticum LE124]|uniref:Uncharacterized protein n=1 Tax=Novosphingobium lindaniclasticum LE124 TaxID=1096930 RepID=T0I331_9SPHN|nr:hypothetical protein L284_00130 [Novosphingobium lindaniclasticum LE124]
MANGVWRGLEDILIVVEQRHSAPASAIATIGRAIGEKLGLSPKRRHSAARVDGEMRLLASVCDLAGTAVAA